MIDRCLKIYSITGMSLIYNKLCISAISGGGGKTLVSLGLARALTDKGIKIKPYKKGPDYIDAKWLSLAAKTSATNLDLFFIPTDKIASFFECSFLESISLANGNNMALIEGNRGLFDGLDPIGSYSTSELCRSLKCPILLSIDCTKMTRTVAALLQGILNFENNLEIVGVILNKVGSSRHERSLCQAIEYYTNLKIFGALPRLGFNPLPERHMGLASPGGIFYEKAENILKELARIMEDNVNLGEILQSCQFDHFETGKISEIISSVPNSPVIYNAVETERLSEPKSQTYASPRIGYVLDDALWFYYAENLKAIKEAGANLVQLSLLDNSEENLEKWQKLDGIYLGGGFPEDYAERISASSALQKLIGYAAQNLPIYAECGGLIVLSKGILLNNKYHKLGGILPFDVQWQTKPQGLGYMEATVLCNNPYFKTNSIIRGHEFHYSSCVLDNTKINFSLGLKKGKGICGKQNCQKNSFFAYDGLSMGNIWASYMHIFAPAIPEWAPNFVSLAKAHAAGLLPAY